VGHPSLPLANPSRTLSFLSLAHSRPLPCLSLWMLSHWRVPSFTAPMLSLSLISQREGKVKITGKALIFPFNIWVKFVFFSSNLSCFLSLISHLSNLSYQRWIADDSSIDLLDSPSWVTAFNRSHLDCQRGIISGLEAEECPEKSKQWLLRIDTIFLQLFFPLQEVVTTRTTLLILTGWHLGIAVRFEPVWKGNKPNRTEINQFEPVFGSVWFKN